MAVRKGPKDKCQWGLEVFVVSTQMEKPAAAVEAHLASSTL